MPASSPSTKSSRRAKSPSDAPRPWVSLAAAVSFGIVVPGIIVSLTLFASARQWETQVERADLHANARERADLVQSTVSRSLEALHAIAALHEIRDDVSRGEFRRFVGGALRREPGLQALGWTPRVPAAEREKYEAAARADGHPDFRFAEYDAAGRLVPAAARNEYYPVYFIEPEQGNAAAVGFELDSSPEREAAIAAARDTGIAAATAPIRLVQEAAGRLGFIVYVPVYRGPHASVEDRRRNLIGLASAVFRIDDLLRPALSDLARGATPVRIVDGTGGAPIYASNAESSNAQFAAEDSTPPDLRGEAKVHVGGRAWVVQLSPAASPGVLSLRRSSLILFGSLTLTACLAAYLGTWLRRTQTIERLVHERTAQLASEVTVRRRAESSARLAEAKYRSIFEHSFDGIFQSTPDGHYLAANKALAGIYGYDSPDQLLHDLSNIAGQLYVDPRRRGQFVVQVQQLESVRDFESEVYRRDRSVIWIKENARTVRDDDGNVLYYEGSVTDITRRKAAEELLRRTHEQLEHRVTERTRELARANAALMTEIVERRRAEEAAEVASRAKGDFLATMSHEIRTPMNAILGYAQVLRGDASLSESHREAVDIIHRGGSHLLALINDVLDLSKIEAGHMELHAVEFDLGDLCESVAMLFGRSCGEKNVALHAEGFRAPGPVVCGDDRKLRQVLINLVGNAVKFTDHGSVTLRVVEETSGQFCFDIEDTGVGIPPQVQASIFEPFHQELTGQVRGGSGLGLAISKRHIEIMGGELSLDSAPGRGSRFSFRLSLPPVDAKAPPTVLILNALEESAPFDPADLPGDLVARLRSAAETNRITDLRECIEAIERIGGETAPIVRRLRRLLVNYDMSEILALVDGAVRDASPDLEHEFA